MEYLEMRLHFSSPPSQWLWVTRTVSVILKMILLSELRGPTPYDPERPRGFIKAGNILLKLLGQRTYCF
jgi:hypothetical protein